MPNPHFDILTAVASSLSSPAISGLPTPLVREVPWALGSDALPLCLITPSPDGERVARQTFTKKAWWDYPCLVLLLQAGNRRVVTQTEAWLRLRLAVQRRLFVPTLAGAGTVMDAEVDPQAAEDVQKALGANVTVTGWMLRYRSPETRSA